MKKVTTKKADNTVLKPLSATDLANAGTSAAGGSVNRERNTEHVNRERNTQLN
jgi:hypothetical protein